MVMATNQVTDPMTLALLRGEPVPTEGMEASPAAVPAVDMPMTVNKTGAVTDPDLLSKLDYAWEAENINPSDIIDTLTYETTSGEEINPFDWKKMAAGMSASIAASIPEGKKGYQWGQRLTQKLPNRGVYGVVKAAVPVVTGAVRGSLASAGALGATEFSYDTVDALVSGEEFDPSEAFEQAWDAAETDFIYSSAGSLGLPIVAKGYRVTKEGAKVLRAKFPKKKPITGKAGLADTSINQVAKLQEQLKEMGGSLLPSMVTGKDVPKLLEQIAKVSKFTRGTVENYFNIYGQFMGKQIEDMVGMFSNQGPRKQGKVLQAFIAQNDNALAKIVDPLYKGLAIKGKGVVVDIRQQARELADEIGQSGQYRAQPKVTEEGKLLKRTTARGGVAQVISDLKATPDNLNFYEAHQRLSKIKSTISDLRASSNPDNNLVDVLIKHQRLMESGMDEAASRLSPTLQKEYADVTAYYRKGRQVITAEWLKAAMKNNDPATIGRILTQDGLSEGLIQIKQLRKAAADFKKDLPKPPKGSSQREIDEYNEMLKGLDVDPLEGIRRGFLDEMLRTSPDDAIGSAQQFANKLKQPRFRETFNELFKGTGVPSKMDEMLENLIILSRTDKAQQGFALTLAGAEQKMVSDPKIGIIFKSALPAFLAGLKIRPSSIDKMISLQKAAIAAEKGGVDISQQLLLSLEKLTRRGNIAGTTLSVGQQQKPPTQEYSR
jgi:hypothetical protein